MRANDATHRLQDDAIAIQIEHFNQLTRKRAFPTSFTATPSELACICTLCALNDRLKPTVRTTRHACYAQRNETTKTDLNRLKATALHRRRAAQ
jgi:hypothetical protein